MKNVKFYTKNENSDKKYANVCLENDDRIVRQENDDFLGNLKKVPPHWVMIDLHSSIPL